MRIAFMSPQSPYDISSWSGTTYHILKSLESFSKVDYMASSSIVRVLIGKTANRISLQATGKRYKYSHGMHISRALARKGESLLLKESYDLIFASAASPEIAFLKTDIQIIYCSDSTFNLMHQYYNYFSDLLKISVRHGEEIERRAIQNSSVLLYPSQWAADSAIDHYGKRASDVFVMPFGANLKRVPAQTDITEGRAKGICNLLFIGVDWERKGGPIVYDTFQLLKSKGIDCTLTICGTSPKGLDLEKGMTIIPFIDKSNPAHLRELEELFLRSSFLFVPSRAEAYGIVFSEASAFGLPSISTETGGVPSVIRNGDNGFLLNINDGPEEYSELIAKVFKDRNHYEKLCLNARKLYERELNWEAWTNRLLEIIKNLL